MPIIEYQLNGRIATLLGRMAPRWKVYGEEKGAFRGNRRQPDILIVQPGAQPVVIENEYLPANTVEAEARGRLGESLDADVVRASGHINAAIALRSPTILNDCPGLDKVDNLLKQGIELEYALLTGQSGVDFTRFPKTGYIRGNIRNLAAFVEYAAVPEDAVRRAVRILEDGVNDAAAILRKASELRDDTKQAISEHLKQEYGDQTLRMAATIMINALAFHQNLAGRHGIKNLSQIERDDFLTQRSVLQEWRKILRVNYWSIFSIASDLLQSINPPGMAIDALEEMSQTADKLLGLGVTHSHDLSGTVFQKLIADRKFLATFYTKPESAALLAHLAIPDDGGWGDIERVKNFRIADYACGTGTLIHAAYRRVNQLHWLGGGEPEELHAHMMENNLTACDVLPSSVHLTASMLSSSHPTQRYEGSRTVVMDYGKTEKGGVAIGSLDLLGGAGVARPLMRLHRSKVVTGTGERKSDLPVDMPPLSQDLVIMNPPFTRAGSDWKIGNPQGYDTKTFHGLSTDLETQKRMAELAREYAKGTCAHGYAGIASWFVALANNMVKNAGTIALVLPMTALQGRTWLKMRQLIASKYSDVTILTIAAARQNDQAFSAETGIAETLLVCRKTHKATSGRGLFVSLKRRPNSEMEANEIARVISKESGEATVRRLEDGPFGGSPLYVGDERVGEMIDAPLSENAPWSAVGISDFAVTQTVRQLSDGLLWLPQMLEHDAVPVAMSRVSPQGTLGKGDAVIVGREGKAAYKMIRPASSTSSHPMLWNHDAQREKSMIVSPDSEGRIIRGMESLAGEIWDTRSHSHHNRDFRFNSQPLAVAFTETLTIGGRAWPNVKFDDRAQEIAYTLWGNSTLGLLCYWWHSSRQQAGRGSMPISAIRSMSTLDVTKLTQAQLDKAEEIFEDMRELKFLPANEAYQDNTRKELDYRVLIEMLGLPESILEPLDLLRLKWCSEPSVHGGKKTAPGAG